MLAFSTMSSVYATTTFVDALDVSTESGGFPSGVAFNSAGTKMFVADDAGDILEFDCSGVFDVSTCLNDNN